MGWKLLSFVLLLGISALAYAGAVRTDASQIGALFQAALVFVGGGLIVHSVFKDSCHQ